MAAFIRCNDFVVHHMFRRGAGGPAIIFANSLGTDLRIWDAVVDLLPAEIPFLRYDKRGHGLSESGPISIEILADDLIALMEKLSLTKALVCGVSVGGLIAQQLATARPDLVSGLVLSNTSYQIGDPTSWAERINALEAGGLEPLADGIMERWFSPAFRENETEALAGYRGKRTEAFRRLALRRPGWVYVLGLVGVAALALAVPLARALARLAFPGRRLLVALLGAPFILPVIVAVFGILNAFNMIEGLDGLAGLHWHS